MTWFSLHEWRREEDTSLLSSSLEDFFSLLLYFRGSNLNSPPSRDAAQWSSERASCAGNGHPRQLADRGLVLFALDSKSAG